MSTSRNRNCRQGSTSDWAGAIWQESHRRRFENVVSFYEWLRCILRLRSFGWAVKWRHYE